MIVVYAIIKKNTASKNPTIPAPIMSFFVEFFGAKVDGRINLEYANNILARNSYVK